MIRTRKKIKSLLQAYSGNPPEELMKNYVAEVRKKIQTAPQEPLGLGMPMVLLLIALSFAGALVLMKPAPKKAAPEAAQTETRPEITQAAPQPEDFENLLQQVEEQADFEELSDSLMILELLGEDEGLMDDSGTVEADVEFFAGG